MDSVTESAAAQLGHNAVKQMRVVTIKGKLAFVTIVDNAGCMLRAHVLYDSVLNYWHRVESGESAHADPVQTRLAAVSGLSNDRRNTLRQDDSSLACHAVAIQNSHRGDLSAWLSSKPISGAKLS